MNKQNNPKAIAFLSAHGMYSGQINLDSTLNDFLGQMTAGLRGEPSSIMMIPAYIGAASDLAGKSGDFGFFKASHAGQPDAADHRDIL